ncbi:MAG: histidinol dehydrogenase [Peptococcaceae bacterium]|nr:histidinol dehydrogenase [Candidatus Syntrophopropionicum ammoniitolerans]
MAGTGENAINIREDVAQIIEDVRRRGDQALKELTHRYDRVMLPDLRVSQEAVKKAYNQIDEKTVSCLRLAARRIRSFAEKQARCLLPLEYESSPGVLLGHRLIPVSSCGVYVPSGRYPLPSSALMSIIPARVAGVGRIAACSPPVKAFGGIHPAVLAAMDIAGADEIYCLGGAQAVAAYAWGTESVARVDMIVGPGNAYVTEAKRQVSSVAGIDVLAGPSEVLVIADQNADPDLVAIDLLAQCEHDPTARGILVTDGSQLAERVLESIDTEANQLETGPQILKTWEDNGQVILVDSLAEAAAISNQFAPEHLVLLTMHNEDLVSKLSNYGSLFIGENAPVAFGDYISGTNHILPTMGCARFSSGLWVGTFIKVASWQRLSVSGAAGLADACSHLAGVEGLEAHQRSADKRKGKRQL